MTVCAMLRIMSSLIEKTLRTLGSDYVTAAELAVLLPVNDNARHAQIKRALAQGLLKRLKRGVYRRSGYLEHTQVHPFEASQYLMWPSYISLESALSFHGLIPEAIYLTTCVTTQSATVIKNQLGQFQYDKLPNHDFFVDVQRVQEEHCIYYIANPWKALCDYVYCYNKNWDDFESANESLRLDDSFPKLTSSLNSRLVDYYHNKRISIFLRGVQREY